jgi:D-alanyl-D-alanine carboxypeptidase
MADPAAPLSSDLHGRRSSRPRPSRLAGLLFAAAAGLAVLGVGLARTAGGLAGPQTDGVAGGSPAVSPPAVSCAAGSPAFAAQACPSGSPGAVGSSPSADVAPGPSSSAVPPSSAPPIAGPSSAPLAVRLQAALDRVRTKLAIPGVSATILLPDGTSWTGVSGLADVAARTKVTPETAFAYASVSKTFTSALILQLVGEGRLHLGDAAAGLLPPLRIRIDPRITVGMLLNHTSGLADFFLNPKIDRPLQSSPTTAWTVDRDLRYVGKRLSAPGAAWHYSNTNYLLLGLIAERVTGQTLAGAIRTRLLDPTGLDDTWYQAGEPNRTALAHGYRFIGTRKTAKPIDLADGSGIAPFRSVVTAAGGAGSIAGTSADLARWGRALYSGKVLGPQGTAILLSGFSKTTHYLPGVSYGYGVQAFSIDGHASLGHSGRLLGFRSAVRHFPIDGLTIAVLTNQSRADPAVIVRALLAVAVPAPPPIVPSTPASPAPSGATVTPACMTCRMVR